MLARKRIKYERKFKDMIRTIQMFFQLLLGSALQLIAFYTIYIEFANFKKDTFGLTNYGFAIMLGLSSVCFSWARNLNTDQSSRVRQINDNATTALHGAIIFLLGSAFKYVSMAKESDLKFSVFSSAPWMIYIPKFFAFICFVAAVLSFSEVTTDILRIIAVSKDESWENEIHAKENYSLQSTESEDSDEEVK